MTEYVHLVGAEQVQSAANTMKTAANEMHRAANTISEAIADHNRVMEALIRALEAAREPKP